MTFENQLCLIAGISILWYFASRIGFFFLIGYTSESEADIMDDGLMAFILVPVGGECIFLLLLFLMFAEGLSKYPSRMGARVKKMVNSNLPGRRK